MFRNLLKFIFSLFFIGGGINHFIMTDFYVAIMPPYLPWHLELVYISGIFEIILGTLLLIPKYEKLAGWGLIALLIAVFPANIQMYLADTSSTGLLLRLPIQALLVLWAYYYARRKNLQSIS